MRPHICLSANLSVLPPQHVQRFRFHRQLHIQLLLGMGCTFHGITFLIVNCQHVRLGACAVRLHDLDGLPHGKLVALLGADAACRTLVICRVGLTHQSQVSVALVVRVAVVNLGLFVRSAKEKSGGKFPVSTAADLLLIPGQVLPP